MKGKFLTALTMAVFFVISTGTVGPRAEAADIDAMIANAKTAAEHQAIANYYDQQAAQARDQAGRHQKMKEAYENSPSLRSAGPSYWRVGAKDCQALQRSSENIATQYEGLAKLHRKMASTLSRAH